MYIYQVSPIVSYSPFFTLTYFSGSVFPIGGFVDISFRGKTVLGIVTSLEDVRTSKQSVRAADFKTQKVLSKKVAEVLPGDLFSQLQKIAEKQLVSIGELYYYLFESEIVLQGTSKAKTIAAYQMNLDARIMQYKSIFYGAVKDRNNTKTIVVFSDDVSLLAAKYLFQSELKKCKNILFVKPKEAVTHMLAADNGESLSVIIDNFEYESYHLVQKPHINQLDMLMLATTLSQRKLDVRIFADVFGSFELEILKELKVDVQNGIEKKTKKVVLSLDPESKEYNQKKKEVVPSEILEKIKASISAGGSVLVFVLNHGGAQRIYCNNCNTPYSCHICKNPYRLTVDEAGNYLYCKDCEKKRQLKDSQLLLCTHCGGFDFEEWGLGVVKVAEYLSKSLDTAIQIIDEEKKKVTDTKLVSMVNKDSAPVTVGTIRTLRARVTGYDLIVALSVGDLASARVYQDEANYKLLRHLEAKASELCITRILPRKSDQESGKKSVLEFFEKYKDVEFFQKQGKTTRIVTISFLSKDKKHALKLEEIVKRVGEYTRGRASVFYYVLEDVDRDTATALVLSARAFADVVVSNSVRDFVGLGK